MLREIEKGGIPTVMISSFPEYSNIWKLPRFVRGYGITWPTGNPYISKEKELALRRSIIERALYALQQTPTTPTVYWGNFGNVIGDQESIGMPTTRLIKDWDWTIR